MKIIIESKESNWLVTYEDHKLGWMNVMCKNQYEVFLAVEDLLNVKGKFVKLPDEKNNESL